MKFFCYTFMQQVDRKILLFLSLNLIFSETFKSRILGLISTGLVSLKSAR